MQNFNKSDFNKIQKDLISRLTNQFIASDILTHNALYEIIAKVSAKFDRYKNIIIGSPDKLKKESETQDMIKFLRAFGFNKNHIAEALGISIYKLNSEKKTTKCTPTTAIKSEINKFLSSFLVKEEPFYIGNKRITTLKVPDIRAKLNELYGYERNHSDSSILRILRTQGYALDTNSNKLKRYINNNANSLNLKDIKTHLKSHNITMTDTHIRKLIRDSGNKLTKTHANIKAYLDANKDNLTLNGIKAFLKSTSKDYTDTYIKIILKNYKYELIS